MSGAVLQFCFVVLVEFLACGLCLVSCDFSGTGADVIALVMCVMSSMGCACFGTDVVMVGCIALVRTSYPQTTKSTHGPFTGRMKFHTKMTKTF